MSNAFIRLARPGAALLADGATGTNYFAMGLESGHAPELWNVEHPERVANLHRAFIEAGSDVILTNSFGGSRYRLMLHQAEARVAELNEAAARIAREAADAAGRDVIVAGSMGPTGEIFAPLGHLSMIEGVAAFTEQAEALARGGVDVLWIETLSSREELEAALRGASVTGLPIVCTLSFDTNGRTMMGISPAAFAALCRELEPGPAAYGTNCGLGPAEVVAGVLELRRAANADDLLVAKANCGIPRFVNGEISYDGTPELMAEYTRLARDAGANIIGGCCGTTPEHIRAMREALDDHRPGEVPDLDVIETRLGEISAGGRGHDPARGVDRSARRRRRPKRE